MLLYPRGPGLDELCLATPIYCLIKSYSKDQDGHIKKIKNKKELEAWAENQGLLLRDRN